MTPERLAEIEGYYSDKGRCQGCSFAALAYLVSKHRAEYDGIRNALESGITETELDQLAQFAEEAAQ